MVASVPFAFDGTALVSGKELELVAKNVPGTPTLTLDGKSFIVKSGRFKAKVPASDPNEWPYETLEPETVPVPAGFIQTLRDVRPFVSENATQLWATGVCFDGTFAYATNNIALVRVAVVSPFRQFLLPLWAVDFLLTREEGLTGWLLEENSVTFEWANGGRMRSQLLEGTFPVPSVNAIIDTAGEPTHALDEAWKTVYHRLAAMAEDGFIALYPEHGQAGKESADSLHVEDELKTPGEKSVWFADHLSTVVDIATHWNPERWPNPSPFKSERLQGAIAGRRE
jgi:hypothetical protein